MTRKCGLFGSNRFGCSFRGMLSPDELNTPLWPLAQCRHANTLNHLLTAGPSSGPVLLPYCDKTTGDVTRSTAWQTCWPKHALTYILYTHTHTRTNTCTLTIYKHKHTSLGEQNRAWLKNTFSNEHTESGTNKSSCCVYHIAIVVQQTPTHIKTYSEREDGPK